MRRPLGSVLYVGAGRAARAGSGGLLAEAMTVVFAGPASLVEDAGATGAGASGALAGAASLVGRGAGVGSGLGADACCRPMVVPASTTKAAARMPEPTLRVICFTC